MFANSNALSSLLKFKDSLELCGILVGPIFMTSDVYFAY